MEKNTKSGGIKQTGTSSLIPPSDEENNGETYEVYPGSPIFPEGTIPSFEDVAESDMKFTKGHTQYNEIERLIIQWKDDGTKTAGRLARRIFKLLHNEQRRDVSGNHQDKKES